MKICRAIDVGYGNVKFTVGEKDGEVITDMFPAVANQTTAGLSITGGVLSEKDVVIVDVNSGSYEVGKDVLISKSNSTTPILHSDYVKQPQYMALSLGALAYMDVDHIDILVCGLPVSMMENKEYLIKLMEGEHKIGDRTVTVDKCGVIPQPLGGLLAYGLNSSDQSVYTDLKHSNSLVVDVGFFTFDWLRTVGLKADNTRSSAVAIGASKILKGIADAIAKDYDAPRFNDLHAIDKGLRTGHFRLSGKPIDLNKYDNIIDSVSRDAINNMKTSLGDAYDIDNIMIIGGGAFLFVEALKDAFPRHKIITLDENSIYANVEGYYLRGLKALEQNETDK